MIARIAIDLAKRHVAEIFEPEGAFNIGLEEIRYDDDRGVWQVTVGFSREWDRQSSGPLGGLVDRPAVHRNYKLVEIRDDGGDILGIMNRPLAA